MIASIDFHRFKALRSTRLSLSPCNLVLGPNGSGKTSLIEAVLQLRGLALLRPSGFAGQAGPAASGPRIDFAFGAPYGAVKVRIGCASDMMCNELEVIPPD